MRISRGVPRTFARAAVLLLAALASCDWMEEPFFRSTYAVPARVAQEVRGVRIDRAGEMHAVRVPGGTPALVFLPAGDGETYAIPLPPLASTTREARLAEVRTSREVAAWVFAEAVGATAEMADPGPALPVALVLLPRRSWRVDPTALDGVLTLPQSDARDPEKNLNGIFLLLAEADPASEPWAGLFLHIETTGRVREALAGDLGDPRDERFWGRTAEIARRGRALLIPAYMSPFDAPSFRGVETDGDRARVHVVWQGVGQRRGLPPAARDYLLLRVSDGTYRLEGFEDVPAEAGR